MSDETLIACILTKAIERSKAIPCIADCVSAEEGSDISSSALARLPALEAAAAGAAAAAAAAAATRGAAGGVELKVGSIARGAAGGGSRRPSNQASTAALGGERERERGGGGGGDEFERAWCGREDAGT